MNAPASKSNNWLKRLWASRFVDPHKDRLSAALKDARARLEKLERPPGPPAATLEVCRKCLAEAEQALGDRTRYVAWDCLHRFDGEMLAAMSPDERAARWLTLRAEAKSKLEGSWRGKAADALVEGAPCDKAVKKDPSVLPVELVRELHSHLATTAQNMQFKLEVFERTTLPLITGALVAIVVIALWVTLALANPQSLLATPLPWLDGLDPNQAESWARALALGVFSGALGGVLSMSFSLGGMDLKRKIPEMRLSRWATLTRPFLGAAAAIPIVVLVEGEFVAIRGFDGLPAIFVFCLIGGYSERWFLGVIGQLEAGKK